MSNHSHVDTTELKIQTSPRFSTRLIRVIRTSGSLLRTRLDPRARLRFVQLVIIGSIIFITAVGVRLLHWRDSHDEIVYGKTSLGGVFNRYDKEARRILDEGGLLFPANPPERGDARMLVHPPGYAILLAAIYKLSTQPYFALWAVQILSDGVAAVLVFLIGYQLLHYGVALIAGFLVAVSPHLAFYSLILSPDSLAGIPLLFAALLVASALQRPHFVKLFVLGVLLGLSCWLRANALFLAPFFCFFILASFPRSKRLQYSAAVLAAMLLTIAPITIRNLLVFHHFIPLSIAGGENLVVGIGDCDPENRFGMPHSDREARLKDVEWSGRSDYGASLWTPDGIDRDQVRFARGLQVIRSNPGWFLNAMLRRGSFMLSYNDSRPHRWPFNTAVVPIVSLEPRFGHPLEASVPTDKPEDPPPVVISNGVLLTRVRLPALPDQTNWSSSASDLAASGVLLSKEAAISQSPDKQLLQLAGDNSAYADQFASEPFAVQPNNDYVLSIEAKVLRGDMAVKISSLDGRISATTASILVAQQESQSATEQAETVNTQPLTLIQTPFAGGQNDNFRLVLSNNGPVGSRPEVLIGAVRIFSMGPTPGTWTRIPRALIRGLQRNLFTTSRLTPAIIAGISFLAFAGMRKTVALVLVIPAYYLSLQSVLSTEYRYILPMHYMLLIAGAVTMYCCLRLFTQVLYFLYQKANIQAH